MTSEGNATGLCLVSDLGWESLAEGTTVDCWLTEGQIENVSKI